VISAACGLPSFIGREMTATMRLVDLIFCPAERFFNPVRGGLNLGFNFWIGHCPELYREG
jgi:hypothetical protein